MATLASARRDAGTGARRRAPSQADVAVRQLDELITRSGVESEAAAQRLEVTEA